MKKMGNTHSSLLDSMAKIASEEKKPQPTFDINFTSPKQPTLRELFAQFTEEIDPTMGEEAGPPTGELGPKGELPPAEETVGDTEEAKRNLCEALVALCGSPDEAHSCIDQYCGSEPGGLGDEEMAELPPEPLMDETGFGGEAEPMPKMMPGIM